MRCIKGKKYLKDLVKKYVLDFVSRWVNVMWHKVENKFFK